MARWRVRELVFACGTQGKCVYSAYGGASWQRLPLRLRARLLASVPSVVHSNKRLMVYEQEQEFLRRGKRGRERIAAIPP
jgi:hypothetical protein